MNRPVPVVDTNEQSPPTEVLDVISDQYKNEYMILSLLRSSNDEHLHQIQVKINKPLTYPLNSLILKGYNFGDIYVKETLGSVGTYYYTWIDSVELSYQVQWRDVLGKEDVFRIELKNN